MELTDKLEFRSKGCSMKKLYFYILIFGSVFIVPILGIAAPAFMLIGITMPIVGLLKVLGTFLGVDTSVITVRIADFSFSPMGVLIFSVIAGILLYLLGKLLWGFLRKYFDFIIKAKAALD